MVSLYLFRNPLSSVWLLLALLLALFFSGPRVDADDTIAPLILPPDLDTYLARNEGRYDDIVPGTEKKIFWAGRPGEQTPLALVYIHGFSATRQDTAPLAALVARELNANLFCTRLTGHGRGGEAMAEGSVKVWVNDMHEAMEVGKRLGRRVALVGCSTGATLALWQAAQGDVEALAALVLISPNFGPADRRTVILTWPWGVQMTELLVGKTRSWQPKNEAQGRYWTHSYPVRTLAPMMGLVKKVRSFDLRAITFPTVIIYSPKDTMVDPEAIVTAFHALGAEQKELIAAPGAGDSDQHVLAGDILSPAATASLAETIIDFLRK
jgi:esterase/lipase